MIRLRWIVFVLVLLSFGVGVTRAQSATTWYWAVSADNNQLLAYSTDGQTKTLIEGQITKDDYALWRLDADSAVTIMKVNGVSGFYHLASDAANPISVATNDIPNPSARPWRLITQFGQYAILGTLDTTGLASNSFKGLLIDTNSNTGIYLTGDILSFAAPFTATAFSADGRYLRYVSSATDDPTAWTIRERKLETGQERIIYHIHQETSQYFAAQGTQHGDYWLDSVYDSNQKITTYTLIDYSGQTRMVAQEPDSNPRFWAIQDNALITIPAPNCQSDCSIDVQTLPQGKIQHFPINASDVNTLSALLILADETHLLEVTRQAYWLSGTDGAVQKLGNRPISVDSYFNAPRNRWLLLVDKTASPTHYQVWDTSTQKIISEGDFSEQGSTLPKIAVWADGFLTLNDDTPSQLYRLSDGKVFDLPDNLTTFFEVTPDGSILYTQDKAGASGQAGIYRYDPDNATYTLLVPDASPILFKGLDES